MNNNPVLSHIMKNFPNTATKVIANELNLTISQVRTIAKRHNVVKCEKYKQILKKELVINRRKWYEESIPNFGPTYTQEQIIFGSLLGDGYISKGAQRSENCYYQEHFGENQREYREWKLSNLRKLGFSIKGNFLRSKSHPYFTSMRQFLYPNGIKTLTNELLSKCTDPIFLLTLYLDDGSLTISYHYNEKKHIVYCHPKITLYSLNFTKLENEVLAAHLNQTFQTNFIVTAHPDGHKNLLTINKASEVKNFLNIVNPYVKEIPSMKYKSCLNENIRLKTDHIKNRFGRDVRIKISSSERRQVYTSDEIDTIIMLKNNKTTDQEIADHLDRTYWSVVYKISELRKEGLL